MTDNQRDQMLTDALYGVIETQARLLMENWTLSHAVGLDKRLALKSAIQMHGKALGAELTTELLEGADKWIDSKAEPSISMWG